VILDRLRQYCYAFFILNSSFIIGLLKHGSLEVALGAVVMSMVVASTAGTYVPSSVYFSLFLAVWFIYILDRLFDAKKILAKASNPRHHFYQQHFGHLLSLLVLIGCTGLFSLFYLPAIILLYGVLVMGSCLLYLLWVFLSARSLPKEVIVAVLYTTGISLAPRALTNDGPQLQDLLFFLVIFLIALINLILFSRHEQQYDLADKQVSFITTWSPKHVDFFLKSAFVLAFLGIVCFSFVQTSPAVGYLQISLGAMLAVLWWLYQRMTYLENALVYRLIGDGIFLIPAFLLI
jgi:hypothetical protein